MPRVASWLLWLAVGCHRGDAPETPVTAPANVLEAARARPVPDPLRARFNVKLQSKPLGVAATTGGGLVVDRPGKGRLELFGPLGNPLVTVSADGVGLSVLLTGEKKHLVAADAEAVLRDTTGGVAGLDDLLALLVGDLPFDQAPVRFMERVDTRRGDADKALARAVLDGPQQSTVDVLLDPDTATPDAIVARNQKGETLLSATYDRFEPLDGLLVPTRVQVYVPSIDLSVEAKYRGWEALEAPDPALFALDVAPELPVESLEEAVRRMVEKMAPATAPPPP